MTLKLKRKRKTERFERFLQKTIMKQFAGIALIVMGGLPFFAALSAPSWPVTTSNLKPPLAPQAHSTALVLEYKTSFLQEQYLLQKTGQNNLWVLRYLRNGRVYKSLSIRSTQAQQWIRSASHFRALPSQKNCSPLDRTTRGISAWISGTDLTTPFVRLGTCHTPELQELAREIELTLHEILVI